MMMMMVMMYYFIYFFFEIKHVHVFAESAVFVSSLIEPVISTD